MAESKRNRKLVYSRIQLLTGAWVFCFLLWITFCFLAVQHRKNYEFPQLAHKIITCFNNSEQSVNEFIASSPELFSWKISDKDAAVKIKQLPSGIDLQVYESDSLVFWTSIANQVHSLNAFATKGVQLVRQKNGWFGVIGVNDPAISVRHAVFVIPILYDYEINNRYLKDEYLLSKEIQTFIELSVYADSLALPLTDLQGNQIGWIKENKLRYEVPCNNYSLISDFLLCVFFLLLTFIIYEICRTRFSFLFSMSAFVLLTLSLRLILPLAWSFDGFRATELFNPNVFASDYWNSSLGVVLLQAFLIFVCVLMLYGLKSKIVAFTNHKKVRFFLLLVPWVWYLSLWPLSNVISELILNSVVSLEVQNVYAFTWFSLAILLLIGCSAFSFIIFSNLLLEVFSKNLPISQPIKILYFLLVTSFFIITWFLDVQTFAGIGIIFISTVYVMGYLSLNQLSLFNNRVSRVFVVLLFSSCITGCYIEFHSHEKAIQQAESRAGLFGDDRDYVAEYTFTDVHCRVTDDPIVKSAIGGNKLLLNSLESRLNALYFRGYLGRFDVELGVYDRDSIPLLIKDSTRLSEIIKYEGNFVFETSDIYLHFIESGSGTYFYDALVPVIEDTTVSGYLRFKMLPRSYTQTAVYPELLLGNAIRSQVNLKGVNYAVYKDSILYKYEGDFSFPKKFNFISIDSSGQGKIQDANRYSHVVYRTKRNKYVVVPVVKSGWLQFISRIASIFAFLAVCWIIGIVLKGLYLLVFSKSGSVFKYWSFSDRVNFLMIFVLVVSFVSVALVISIYFNDQYSKNHKELLLKKHKEVINIIQERCRSGSQSLNSTNRTEFFKYLIPSLADEKEIDINVFDPNGKLLISSRPSIFEKNLIGIYMNPQAYLLLKDVDFRILVKESIGSLSFLSVYETLYDAEGKTLAIIQIPYFSQAENLQKDISRFLVALVNVFIPVLMLSVFISLLISNSVTEPIVRVGNKLSLFRLGKKNERIEWNRKDEIGILVEEYNTLIEQLEKSAHNLAKSEREGAWKEMAKQIAHEIKNPLTPMKLSIQLLKKATEEGRGDTKELIQRTSITLIEQIDHLSEIASAFSNFAKMPEPELKPVNLIQAIHASVNLFNENDKNVKITWDTNISNAYILADDNQLLSVFNNVLQNAIQSIPEERDGLIIVSLNDVDSLFVIKFIDNGLGIPEDIRERVFTPHFTTKNSGTGLGLAISKNIVEAMGGNISFDSQINMGTTFVITFKKSEKA